MTFGTLLQAYLSHLGNRPSRAKYEQICKQFFDGPEWRDKRALDIVRADVILLKQALAATPAHANKVIGLIKQAYSWASDLIDPLTRQPLYGGQNPAWRVNGHECMSRERIMDYREIGLLLNALDFLSPKYHAFFACRILVPCRIKELCTMRRDAVDANGKWFKRVTKNGRKQYILIPRQAMALLNALPVEGEYYFMGLYDKPLQEGSARKVWERLRKELRMPDVWLLDFRRTLASYLYNEIKADDLTAKAVLNHYDSRPVAIYTRLNFDKLAEIGQAYADWMWTFKQEVSDESIRPEIHVSHDSLPAVPGVQHSPSASAEPVLL